MDILKSGIPDRARRFGGALLRNFVDGCRVALLLPVAERSASWLQIAVALSLCALPPFAAQWLQIGRDGQLSIYGLQGIWFPFAVCVLVAALWTRPAESTQRVPRLVALLLNTYLAIDSIATIAASLLQNHDGPYETYVAWYLDGAWLGLACAVLLARRQWAGAPKRRLLAIVAGIAVALLLIEVMPERDLWSDAYDDEAPQQDRTLAEAVFYRQPELLDEKLERIKPGPANIDNLYFLGVAGDAGENVFRRELRSVERLFLDRYTTRDRSLLLINNRQTLRSEPIASVTALQAAIDRFGEVMDRDRDVLFIYLTSHGSQEQGFALEMPPLALDDLQPATLRAMLDEAGIRWRVVVVSACYAGVFIGPLADDHTLVITAAAADKTSFGCADENDFTYFGRAYFVDALGGTESFIDAFDVAKQRVTERERAEKQEPSEPQIAIGSQIRAKLDAFIASRHAKP